MAKFQITYRPPRRKLRFTGTSAFGKASLALVLALLLMQSCVPHRKYAALEDRYNALIESNDSCQTELTFTKNKLSDVEKVANELDAKVADIQSRFVETEALYNKVKESYEVLGENYRKLIESKSEDLARLDAELKDMESKLSEKDDDLSNREADLIKQQSKLDKLAADVETLRLDLEQREKKVKELESIIDEKDAMFKQLTERIIAALSGDDAKGLEVTNKDGKIYVSVESELLFKPGRTDIDEQGEKALLRLSETLSDLNDIEIIVEGHTDKQPIKTARFADNWDLSVLRATSVVRLLTEKGGVSPSVVIASGRAEHKPVDSGNDSEAFAKNRRIEIIIAPNLDKIYQLIQN